MSGKPKHERHGHSSRNGDRKPSRTYQSWYHARSRCNDPNNAKFHRYGGRGITFCPAWDSYEQFRRDMGERPPGKTLDRIDNDGNYCPENCRWATPAEQGANSKNGLATHCKHGHAYTSENTYIEPGVRKGMVKRKCRTCLSQRSHAFYIRKKAARDG